MAACQLSEWRGEVVKARQAANCRKYMATTLAEIGLADLGVALAKITFAGARVYGADGAFGIRRDARDNRSRLNTLHGSNCKIFGMLSA